MAVKKKEKKTRTSNSRKASYGISKFASLTTSSLSKAFIKYKKNQEIKKIKEIKLKKLEENNQILKEKKELKVWEEKLQKENSKLKFKEDELKLREKRA